MSHLPLLVLPTLLLFMASPSFAFLEKNWVKTNSMYSTYPGLSVSAQKLKRYFQLGDQVIPLATMTIVEINKKNIKAGDPDIINIGLGNMFGFKYWDKRQEGNDFRYIGVNPKDQGLMQVAWKSEKDRFLYAVAIVEGEAHNPVAYEVEYMQRQLLKGSKSFAAMEWWKFFLDMFMLPSAVAQSNGSKNVKIADYFGSPEEVNALINILNADGNVFSRLYADLKDASTGLAQVPPNLIPASEDSGISASAFKEMYESISPQRMVQSMAVGAAVAPMAMASSWALENIDKIYLGLKEFITKEKANLKLLEDSANHHKNYYMNSLNNERADAFKESLTKLKLALDRLKFTQLDLATIGNKITVYKRFREKYGKCQEDLQKHRLNDLIEALEKLNIYQENGTLKKFKICKSIKNLGVYINGNLIAKDVARRGYLSAINPILDNMRTTMSDGKSTAQKISASADDSFAKAKVDAEKRLVALEQTYGERQKQRIKACEEKQKETKKGNQEITAYCYDYDLKEDPLNRNHNGSYKSSFKKLDTIIDNFNRSALFLKEGGSLENNELELTAYENLSETTRKMTEEGCLEPGGKCPSGLNSEGLDRATEYLKKNQLSRAQLKKTCPELDQ